MTLAALLIFIGGPCLIIAIILGVDRFFNRKIKRPEIEHLGAGVEADQRMKPVHLSDVQPIPGVK